MPESIETPIFNFFELEASFEAIKGCKNFPEAFYYEIFVIAKSTADKNMRTECTNIIKKQAPEALQLAFTSRKKLTQKGGIKSVNARLISILEYGLLSVDLDLFKLYTLISRAPELGLYSFSKEFLVQLLEHPEILGRFNGIESLEIHLKGEGNTYDNILNEIPKLTALKTLDLEGEFEQLPEAIGNLPNLKKLKLVVPCLKSFPNTMSQLTSLKKIGIEGAYWSGNSADNLNLNDFNWLSALTKLKALKLQYVGVQDLSQVVFPESLKRMDLFNLDELTALPKDVSHLKQLKRFMLLSKSITNLPNGFEDLPKLEHFELIAPKIDTVSATLFFGDASRPKLVTKIGNSYINITPMTEVSLRESIEVDSPKLLHFVLDNASFFPNLKTITVDCEAPEIPHKTSLAVFKNLTTLHYKLEHKLDWLFEGIEQCINLKNIELYRFQEWHTKDIKLAVRIFPSVFSKIEQLDNLTIKNASALVVDTDHLPKHITNLTISEIKGIKAGTEQFDVFNVEVKATPILNLQEFYALISAAKFNLGHRNDDVNNVLDFENFRHPEKIESFDFTSDVSQLDSLLKNFVNLKELTITCKKNNPEHNNALTAYKHTNLKVLRIEGYNGTTEALERLLTHTPNLEFLGIFEATGFDTFPAVNLPQLKKLRMQSVAFKTIDNLSVETIEAVKLIHCDHIADESIEVISSWNTLKHLWLEGLNENVTAYPESIAKLNLETFFIRAHNRETEIPTWIAHMQSLRVLGLNHFKQVVLPTELASLSQLEVLSISGCEFSEQVSEDFRNLNLKKLVYWTSKFNGSNMKSELYEPLEHKLVSQRNFDDVDSEAPFRI
ncbi:leucine-rich repeat domain-containing protein [Formosa algae]|uniref:Leucine-rich repeat (LRR) protein n=1 Tax=Formosa algae TaxID=225843 RepID=A0A9X1CCR8_9FLAO|nr:hypothetical protein [Formosa algae]MBP1840575.1 Leucine-rich repeat (LRR) protein [Formosa algae]MDQ0336012.1 Leucine-rich repeat (LRR) protein [Formosa algae]OEI81099.1 hypothetical protein AST99_05415 [Formosa algae]